ncbi:hypothetical protein H3C65_03775 [Patescibacteria group bacterium]|nr:hypothetical protein [Patescibacteria group bacterium]
MAFTKPFIERFQKVFEGLNQMMDDYPRMEGGHHLKNHLESAFQEVRTSQPISVEMIWLDSPSEEQLLRFCDFSLLKKNRIEELTEITSRTKNGGVFSYPVDIQEQPFFMSVYRGEDFPIRSTAHQLPAVKLLFKFNGEKPEVEDIDSVLLRTDSEGGLIIFIQEGDNMLIDNSDGLRVLNVEWSALPENLDTFFELNKLLPVVQLMQHIRYVEGMEKISEAFQQYMGHQERDMKTRRFNAQQEINNLKERDQLDYRDFFQKLKSGLQRDFSELENGINEKIIQLRQLHNPKSLMSEVEKKIDEIDQLSEEEFAGNILMGIPEVTRQDLLAFISQNLKRLMMQGIQTLDVFLSQEVESIKDKMKEKGLRFSYQPSLNINTSRIELNLMEYLQFQQKYEVEKKKLEFTDYMRAALAPFMSLMSLFILMRFGGNDARKSFNSVLVYIGLALIPIAAFGFYKFLQNSKEKKARDYVIDLQKMKSSLINESKNIVNKFSSEWQKEVVDAIRSEMNQMINAMDPVFASSSESMKKDIANQQRSVQRRLQGLEQRERSHQNVARTKESYDKALAQFKGELMNQYNQLAGQL